MTKSAYPRGSEWRRWDLHIHTPESVLNDEFGTWDEYITALEVKGKGVSVVGITDYCGIDGYKHVLDQRKNGRLTDFALVVPNIEFRISPELPDGRAINIHILISPDDPEHVEKIEQALRKLKFSWNGNPYACARDELIALGRAVKSQGKEETIALKNGVNAFKPSFETLRDWFNENRWLQDNSLIVVSNGKDGASGLSKDAGFSATRDELYRFSHAVFSGNPKDRIYFLGQGSDPIETLIEEKGSLKPCIHGSDAHKVAKLFAPDLDRYCWIKADPTFEGLRQILHEPADRIYLGPTAPTTADSSKVISSVEIKDGTTWFADGKILLNPGLVAVIGEKGSGKTALADLIAYACGAWTGEGSNSSFINKARTLLGGIQIIVHWADGHKSSGRLDRRPTTEFAEVRYLSQDFVEQLCSQDFKGEQLVAEVENVVFTHIDEAERLDASSFQELRRVKTAHLYSRRSELRAKLSQLNDQIVRYEDELAGKPKKAAQIKQHDEAIAAIDKQLPALQAASNKKVADELTVEKGKLSARTARLTELNKRKSLVATALRRAQDYFDSIEEGFLELKEMLTEIELSADEIAKFKPSLTGKPTLILTKLQTSSDKEIATLKGDPANPQPKGDTIADIQHRISSLEKRLAADEKVRERLLELQRQKQKLENEKARLVQEIQKLDTVILKSLSARREDRWKVYLSYFDLLAEERKELVALYKPLGKVIAEDASGTKSGFNLNVRQIVDEEAWIGTGADLLDARRKEVDIRTAEFGRRLKNGLGVAWRSNDKAAIRTGLEKLVSDFRADGPEANKLLVSHATRVKLYDWLFSPEHVRIDYGLTYQGTDLEALSPGTRGIVLLVLYLAMDHTDRRPLIIDQPEGNLDNSSIYDSLVPFLRQAKKLRQVILVTHNPNLVVTTDADQLIVAVANKPSGAEHAVISYECGSLEHSGDKLATRDRAVRLLEGGKRPFKIREGRWAISNQSGRTG